MREINMGYLDSLAPHLLRANYDDEQPELAHYDAHIETFRRLVEDCGEQVYVPFSAGLRDTIGVLLSYPAEFELNDWLGGNAGHYLDCEEDVRRLLRRVWSIFFPGENWNDLTYRTEPYEIVDGETEY